MVKSGNNSSVTRDELQVKNSNTTNGGKTSNDTKWRLQSWKSAGRSRRVTLSQSYRRAASLVINKKKHWILKNTLIIFLLSVWKQTQRCFLIQYYELELRPEHAQRKQPLMDSLLTVVGSTKYLYCVQGPRSLAAVQGRTKTFTNKSLFFILWQRRKRNTIKK